MNSYFIKIKIITAIFLFALLPSVLFAQTGKQICSSDGYTITTINGVFTDENGAIANRDALKYYFDDTYNGETLTVHYLLNPSHLGGIGDLAISVYQKLFESETVADYDLVEMLKDASAKVQTQKLLLVAHSQGNFYANSFYDTVAGKEGGVPAKSIGIYSVANPASRVAGNGKWMTSDTDHVIAGLVQHLAFFRKIMPTNEHIAEVAGGLDPSSGHDLTTVYLKYRSTEIVKGIQESLDKLSYDPSRSESAQCIDTPKLSVAHKIEGAVLAVADPVATVGVKTVVTTAKVGVFIAVTTVKTVATTAVWTYDTTVAIGKTVGNTAVTVVSNVFEAVTGVLSSKSLAENNTAAVILATEAGQTQKVESVRNQVTTVTNPVTQSQMSPVDVSQKQQTETVTSRLAFTGSYSAGVGGGGGGGGGGALAPLVAAEVKDDAVATTTAIVLEEASTTTRIDTIATNPSSVTPISPSGVTIASTTVTFSGTYTNNDTFDTIVFELKNISTSTATSSVSHIVATTTGTDLPYIKEITLSESGDWQYRARLEDSVNVSSTPWSAFFFFNLATSTNTTATSTTATTTATSTADVATSGSQTGIIAGATVDYGMGATPQGIAFDYITNSVWVTDGWYSTNRVLSMDIDTGKINFNISGHTPYSVIFDDITNSVWIANTGYQGSLSKVNIHSAASTNYLTESAPLDLALDNITNSVWATRTSDGVVSKIDIYTGERKDYATGGPYPYSIAFDNITNSVWVGDYSSSTISKIDIYTGAKMGVYPTGDNPTDIAFDNITHSVWVTNGGTNTVSKIDIYTGARIDYVVGNNPYGIVFDNITHSVWVSNYVSNTISKVNIYTGAKIDYDTRSGPFRLAFDGITNSVWIANRGSGSISKMAIGNPYVSTQVAGRSPILSSARSMQAFDISLATSTITGVIDEKLHTVSLKVPFGTDVLALAPMVTVSALATSNPASLALEDFTNPVEYTVTAEDGAIQKYTVSVIVSPAPDTIPPTITGYTFNGTEGSIEADFATTTPSVTIVLTAGEKVDWVSIKIEDQSNPSNDKIFYSSEFCADGTATCVKSWDGVLSGGVHAPDGVYRIKVNIKDLAGNSYKDYLLPYFITIKTATSP